ncbi:universal stress protein [Thiobacillus thioparus]|jgi:nucleotide-binding universal stress UspA family protein|uniref:universal stress protein n=1 Tax=Thiobacillus thioparus TaxID=931 RepID=UPI00036A8722|nr:universal stress protein [Thiobacillus thioparus]
MYKSILVAIDGSQTSELALNEAIQFARAAGSRLRIVNVVDEVNLNWSEFPNTAELWDVLVASGRALLGKAASTAAEAGVEADTRLIELDRLGDRIPDALAREADAWPADLIVVGTHGRRGLSHLLLGSVAEGIVRVASKPVLLVRGK